MTFQTLCKSAVLLLCMVACKTNRDSSSTKDVQDIAAVTNNGQGLTVVCKDAQTNTYTAAEFQQKVADNSICDGTSGAEFMCVGYNSTTSQVALIANGETIGTNVAHEDCHNAIQASHSGLICIPYNAATSQVYYSKTQQNYGSNIPHADCDNAVRKARDDFVCEGYNSTTSQIMRLATCRRSAPTSITPPAPRSSPARGQA